MWVRIFLLCCFCSHLLYANRVIFARIEPYETYSLKAAVSGKVLKTRQQLLGKVVEDNEPIVHLDDFLDKQLLESDEQSLKRLESRITALQKSLQIRQKIAEDIASLQTKSKIQKDTEELNALNAEVNLLQSMEQFYTLQKQIAERKDTISKKNLRIQGLYFYKLYVTEGDFVAAGSALADVMDISQAKIIFFLTQEEIEKIKKGTLLIDGIPLKDREGEIEKIYRVADQDHISEYRVEVKLKGVDFFSKLVRIEIKE
ncbi:hypothetical protein CCZ01_08960 [Helicobacter monodelphidis]|uniref:HlyD family efflux transporter periplasmic adaptor subunit n=1 Tax=Helicobacter sp. 15-1451 TaxID=2004995 RepID=UPI000DCC4F66|nr:HlyD family efflux transporter periplasmic adaptor subunit [Helicobacter sp. 15-1451]RAX56627.1 hypothetical protein CCZ01_08960 [Helicobacter sp. 15-1451]